MIILNIISDVIFKYISDTIPSIVFMMLIDVNMGHGLIVTMWKG